MKKATPIVPPAPKAPVSFGFVGAKSMGLKVLTALLEAGLKPRFVLTLPNQTAQELANYKQLAHQHNVPCYVESNLDNHKAELAACHYVLVARFSIIPKAILKLPKWGFINAHPSLLPNYRGVHPVSWALINGESKTGVTLHYMTEKVDEGDVIVQRHCSILPHHTIHTLSAALDAMAAQMARQLVQTIDRSGTAPAATPQSPGGSYAKARTPSDSRIDWQAPAEQIVNLVRALQPPYPLAFALTKDEKPIQFIKAHTIVCTKGKVGDVMAVHPPKLLTVRCQHHAVVLEATEPLSVSVGDNLVTPQHKNH